MSRGFIRYFFYFLLASAFVLIATISLFAEPYENVLDIRNKAMVSINDQTLVVDIANTEDEQIKGLMGRESLGINEGMLFVFDYAAQRTFWMKNMNFPIDIIWISDGEVIGVERDVQPEPGVSDENLSLYRSPVPVDWVLEVAAGRAGILDAKAGDLVEAETLISWGEDQLK